jgi:hypothetical protein
LKFPGYKAICGGAVERLAGYADRLPAGLAGSFAGRLHGPAVAAVAQSPACQGNSAAEVVGGLVGRAGWINGRAAEDRYDWFGHFADWFGHFGLAAGSGAC